MGVEQARTEAEHAAREEAVSEHHQQLVRHVQASARELDELAGFLAASEMRNEVRRAAMAALRMHMPQFRADLTPLLVALDDATEARLPDVVTDAFVMQAKQSSPARKVSVSMPEDLTAAVQHRVGRGKFSQYVTEAVARQLELDLLADLSDLLASEYGQVPEEYLAEAQAAWPDEE